MSSVDECVEQIVTYIRTVRHDTRIDDDGLERGVRDLIDDLLTEDQIGDE